jgi:hypothetical protein
MGNQRVSPEAAICYGLGVRPFIREVIDGLVDRHGTTTRVDLNDIAEIIGDRTVSYEEVEAIITELEVRGCAVGGEPTVREMAMLREVLTAARELKGSLGRQPRIDEIAAAVSQPAFVVRRALENGGTLGPRTNHAE